MEEIEIYKKIGIKEFYITLIEKFNQSGKIPLEIIDKNIILEICQSLNIKAKFYTKEKFYRLFMNDTKESFINLVIKYGYLECGFYLMDINNKIIGSTLNSMCLKIDLTNGIERPNILPNLCIGSYDEVKEIIEILDNKYKSFYLAAS